MMRCRAPASLGLILALGVMLPAAEARADDAAAVKQVAPTPPLPPSSKPMLNKLGAPPTKDIRADTAPDARKQGKSRQPQQGVSGRAYGSFGIPYTSVRVEDSEPADSATQPNRLSTTYPYRTIGRLDFKYYSYDSWCSASLIMRSVLVTAAHCAADFGLNTYYSSWTFRPGFYGPDGSTQAQQEPFGAWTTEGVSVAQSWLTGRDTGFGDARNNDLAVFIVKKNNQDQFIGDVVGWMTYGWNNYSFTRSVKTRSVWTGAVTTLGYPYDMDKGEIMQRADGPAYLTTVRRAKQMWQGSNFTGGSSGGPWIVNFGYKNADLYEGAVPGTASGPNTVVGVTSWGSADPNAIKDNYSSQFAQNREFPSADYGGYGAGNIGALLQALCSSVKPGGSETYAALGYCDK